MKRPGFLIVLAACFPTWLPMAHCQATPPQSTPVAEVYLLAGQSNMVGIGLHKDLPASAKTPCEQVFFWNGTQFEPLIPGKTVSSYKPELFGPELGFAAALRRAKGKTPIQRHLRFHFPI